MTCDNCKTDGHSKLRSIGGFKWVCRTCVPSAPLSNGAFNAIGTVYIRGYGNASVKRIKALESRVILPYAPPDGSYFVGTRLPSGKILEKKPDYSK